MAPSELPRPSLDFGLAVFLLLHQLHPALTVGHDALLTLDDLLHDVLRRISAALALVAPARRRVADDCTPYDPAVIRGERTLAGERQYLFSAEAETTWTAAEVFDSPRLHGFVEEWRALDVGSQQQRTADYFERRDVHDWDMLEPDKGQTLTEAADVLTGNAISTRCIQSVIRAVLPCEMAKYAVSEGTKAVIKFQCEEFSFVLCSSLQSHDLRTSSSYHLRHIASAR